MKVVQTREQRRRVWRVAVVLPSMCFRPSDARLLVVAPEHSLRAHCPLAGFRCQRGPTPVASTTSCARRATLPPAGPAPERARGFVLERSRRANIPSAVQGLRRDTEPTREVRSEVTFDGLVDHSSQHAAGQQAAQLPAPCKRQAAPPWTQIWVSPARICTCQRRRSAPSERATGGFTPFGDTRRSGTIPAPRDRSEYCCRDCVAGASGRNGV